MFLLLDMVSLIRRPFIYSLILYVFDTFEANSQQVCFIKFYLLRSRIRLLSSGQCHWTHVRILIRSVATGYQTEAEPIFYQPTHCLPYQAAYVTLRINKRVKFRTIENNQGDASLIQYCKRTRCMCILRVFTNYDAHNIFTTNPNQKVVKGF